MIRIQRTEKIPSIHMYIVILVLTKKTPQKIILKWCWKIPTYNTPFFFLQVQGFQLHEAIISGTVHGLHNNMFVFRERSIQTWKKLQRKLSTRYLGRLSQVCVWETGETMGVYGTWGRQGRLWESMEDRGDYGSLWNMGETGETMGVYGNMGETGETMGFYGTWGRQGRLWESMGTWGRQGEKYAYIVCLYCISWLLKQPMFACAWFNALKCNFVISCFFSAPFKQADQFDFQANTPANTTLVEQVSHMRRAQNTK